MRKQCSASQPGIQQDYCSCQRNFKENCKQTLEESNRATSVVEEHLQQQKTAWKDSFKSIKRKKTKQVERTYHDQCQVLTDAKSQALSATDKDSQALREKIWLLFDMRLREEQSNEKTTCNKNNYCSISAVSSVEGKKHILGNNLKQKRQSNTGERSKQVFPGEIRIKINDYTQEYRCQHKVRQRKKKQFCSNFLITR